MAEKYYEIDLASFRNWLNLFKSHEIVGFRGLSHSCPLKNYLHTIDPLVGSVSGGTAGSIGRNTHNDMNWEYVPFKPEIALFINAIDNNSVSAVTAKEALQAFDKCFPNVMIKKELIHV